MIRYFASSNRRLAILQSNDEVEDYPYTLRVFEFSYTPDRYQNTNHVYARPYEIAVIPFKSIKKLNKILSYFAQHWYSFYTSRECYDFFDENDDTKIYWM